MEIHLRLDVLSTFLTILAATIATILGPAGVALGAAIAAGVATPASPCDPVRYENVKLNYELGYIDDHKAIDEMRSISELYGEKFPFGELQLTT